jgi:hypothetical protein
MPVLNINTFKLFDIQSCHSANPIGFIFPIMIMIRYLLVNKNLKKKHLAEK